MSSPQDIPVSTTAVSGRISQSMTHCEAPPRQADKVAAKIAVVVPSYRVKAHILDVIADIPVQVERIYVIDDACPEGTGQWVLEQCHDQRVRVHRLDRNRGVGGAVMAGYALAAADGMDVIVKMDGDGQMDASALPELVGPILRGEADYTKGNRFYDLAQISQMPRTRIVGNAVLSFMTKISSGYWDVFDPTNGYTALHVRIIDKLPMRKISRRFFFETDMLFRLNIIRAVVVDVPMDAKYGAETSNLKISKVLFDFSIKHLRNTAKRVFYNYFLRDLSLASIELLLGVLFLLSGAALGIWFWTQSAQTGITASAGSVMLVALQVIVGIQLVLGFLAYDIASVPRRALHRLLSPTQREPRPTNGSPN
ncbi:glycosyltransferase family 2 protein [Pseudoxanthomonas wuyuanensis]|uniref:Glycosyltransferase involved in cell wall bisynthesis n=1 Tax=Pseudoxanthomonas wuyuanensis TaxID=1073196 RepID=A0A286DCH6_9GAMM|nr:Glycosyltransferase involved in cell wall bisynthesis [Pseudoxanthomonas wuyuanensis]